MLLQEPFQPQLSFDSGKGGRWIVCPALFYAAWFLAAAFVDDCLCNDGYVGDFCVCDVNVND